MITLPGSILIGISSPYRRNGLLFEKWRDHYGKDDDDILVVRGTSKQFNNTIPDHIIAKALERDPEAAAAEWLAQWRTDLESFVSRAVVQEVVIAGRREVPPADNCTYVSFVDAAGGSGQDSFTLAVSYIEGQVAILDCVREWRPPFSPSQVVAEASAVLRSYGVDTIRGDRWGGQWPVEQFAAQGISYEPSELTKSQIYGEFLAILNSRRCELLDDDRLIAQLCSLERRVGRGTGRDSIDHPPGGHDDVINSAAGALHLVGADDTAARLRIWEKLGEGWKSQRV